MFQIFNKPISSIDTSKTFLRCIKSLRTLNLETPLTEGYEGTLRKRDQHPLKTWYSNQGEHWQGWLSGYSGTGAYGRKDPNRTPEFIYNHIMCPQMLIWLAESVGISSKIIDQAISKALISPKYQTQCASIRKLIPWDAIVLNVVK